MHFIAGKWLNEGSHTFEKISPVDGKVSWRGFAASTPQITAAVSAARAAFPAWAALSVDARIAYCQAFTDRVLAAKTELAQLISAETGKAPWDAAGEVAAVTSKLAYAVEAYHARTGLVSKPAMGGHSVLRHRPHGVLAVFAPYNFPAHLANGHIIPALIAGNTLVLKPSELTPSVPEWMVKQWELAGLPKGVLNLVQGERETGMALSASAIDGLLFTGSTATGTALHKQFGGRPEFMLALEMGGNNPLIVHEVANIQAAAYETVLSAFTGSGQRCTCARRLILPAGKHVDNFVNALVFMAKNILVGAPNNVPAPFMGPLISNREADRLLKVQDDLQKRGGISLLTMQRMREGLPYLSPGIIDVTAVQNRDDTEYFGPFLQIIRVSDINEAVLEANNTKYGLSAAIFSDDKAVFDRYAPQMHAGLLNWNRQTTGASGAAPFGGVGCSGNHRPAGYYAADYCAYPTASVEIPAVSLPENPVPGIQLAKIHQS
jgi:succinylglutamic semialdehyde dehydrogenase